MTPFRACCYHLKLFFHHFFEREHFVAEFGGYCVDQLLSRNRLMTRRVYLFVEEINQRILPRRGYLKPQFNACLAGGVASMRQKYRILDFYKAVDPTGQTIGDFIKDLHTPRR